MKRLTYIELKIISILDQGEKYGLDIYKEASNSINPILKGSLYNSLNSLLKKKFIKSYQKERLPIVGNTRNYYALTPYGKTRLNSEKKIFMDLWGVKLEDEKVQRIEKTIESDFYVEEEENRGNVGLRGLGLGIDNVDIS